MRLDTPIMGKGVDFEKKIVQLYKDLGKRKVLHDVHLKDKGYYSQFDVVYGSRKKYYVECKYRSQGSIHLAEVATFVAKLSLHNISLKRGIFITNSSYDLRSTMYAKKTGLQLICGDQLKHLQKSRYRFFRSLF